MRTFLRLLPALLTLLVPLLFLAWLGSVEFGRLEDRTRGVLRDQAHTFLDNADRKVRQVLKNATSYRLDALGLEGRDLVEAARELGNDDPWFRNLFLLGQNGNVLFPRSPLSPVPALSLINAPQLDNQSDPRGEFRAAQLLATWGDEEGAREMLQSYAKRLSSSSRGSAEARYLSMRAYFMLAGLTRREAPQKAAEHYQLTSFLAEDLLRRPTRRQVLREASAIRLLSVVATAEISGDRSRHLDVLRDIAFGAYDQDPDEVLDAVFKRIEKAIPESAPERAAARAARQDNEVRKVGRRFALQLQQDGARELANTVQLASKNKDRGPVFHVLNRPGGASLLAMRTANSGEAKRFGAAYVGIQLDFAALLSEDMAAFLSGTERETFLLAIVDPSGVPILPAAPPEAEDFPIKLSPKDTVAGLRLFAIPIASPAADLQATERNRALLVLALVLAAVGGAIFLLRSIQREAELARLKVEFVSRVSHELKTPLSVIKMYSETLQLGRTENETQVLRFGHIISREADRLTAMVERILDFSKQRAETMDYDPTAVDLGELLDEVTDEYLPHIRAQGADLRSALSKGLHVSVDADAMASAFVNLLENAVKFTPPDRSDRTVEVELASNNGHAALEVRDHGIGIPVAERDSVFQPFYRATTSGEVRGAGLGLSMVQHFATAHGGSIEALERPGGGTIMRMTLPLVDKAAERDDAEQANE